MKKYINMSDYPRYIHSYGLGNSHGASGFIIVAIVVGIICKFIALGMM